MKSLHFNIDGYLSPDRGHEISVAELEPLLVLGLPGAPKRARLLQTYFQWAEEVSTQITPTFEVWMDGSFVTRVSEPHDIDLLLLLPHTIWDEKEEAIERLIEHYRKLPDPLDIYKLIRYPPDHPYYFTTISDQAEWIHWFTRTRPNRRRKAFSKGFIILKHGKSR